jgi:hypothetical protein
MFCGGVTDEALCTRCLDAQPRFRGVDIAAWRARHRAFLARSAFLIAPSQWAASMLARYFPGRPIEVIAHGTARAPRESAAHDEPARPAYDIVDNGVPVVAVLGAIGPDKGSRRLERMVERVRSNGSRVRFVLIGYSDAENGPWQNADATFTIHGRYDPHQLPDLFARYRVKLVAFPSTGPESFSLTLSEAWAGGLPVIVPPIGALAERVRATGAGWIWTDAEWRSDEATARTDHRARRPREHRCVGGRSGACASRGPADRRRDDPPYARALRRVPGHRADSRTVCTGAHARCAWLHRVAATGRVRRRSRQQRPAPWRFGATAPCCAKSSSLGCRTRVRKACTGEPARAMKRRDS